MSSSIGVSRSSSGLPSWTFSAVLLTLATVGVGCGKGGGSSLVSGARFSTAEEQGDLFGDLKVVLNTGNVMLPAFDVPILNPRNPGAIYGAVSMRDALPYGTEIGVRVNLSEIAGVEGLDGTTLPNGRPIPVALSQGVQPYSVAIRGNSRVYFAFSESTALIGTAVVISEMDRVGSYVGPIDLFFPFEAENGVRGAAGIFSSVQSGQSGVAVFVDASSVMKSVPQQLLNREMTVAMKSSAVSRAEKAAFRTGQKLSMRQAYRLNQVMRGLGASGKRLRLQ